MKIVTRIVSVILILAGIIWFLQGINVLPGSFMSGRSQYAILGIVVGAIGVGLMIYANRRAHIPDDNDHTHP